MLWQECLGCVDIECLRKRCENRKILLFSHHHVGIELIIIHHHHHYCFFKYNKLFNSRERKIKDFKDFFINFKDKYSNIGHVVYIRRVFSLSRHFLECLALNFARVVRQQISWIGTLPLTDAKSHNSLSSDTDIFMLVFIVLWPQFKSGVYVLWLARLSAGLRTQPPASLMNVSICGNNRKEEISRRTMLFMLHTRQSCLTASASFVFKVRTSLCDFVERRKQDRLTELRVNTQQTHLSYINLLSMI